MTAPSPLLALCRCSHTQRRHEELEGECVAGGCGCAVFRLQGHEVVEEVVEAEVVEEDEAPAVSLVGEQGPVLRTFEQPVQVLSSEETAEAVASVRVISLEGTVEEVAGVEEVSATEPDGDPVDDARALFWAGAIDVLGEGKASAFDGTVQLTAQIIGRLIVLERRLEEEAERARVSAEVAALEERLTAARRRLQELGRQGGATYRQYSCDVEGCVRSFETAQGIAMHRRRAHGLVVS